MASIRTSALVATVCALVLLINLASAAVPARRLLNKEEVVIRSLRSQRGLLQGKTLPVKGGRALRGSDQLHLQITLKNVPSSLSSDACGTAVLARLNAVLTPCGLPTNAITIVSVTLDAGGAVVIVAIDAGNLLQQVLNAVAQILETVVDLLNGLTCDIGGIIPIVNGVTQAPLVTVSLQLHINVCGLPTSGLTTTVLTNAVIGQLAPLLTPWGIASEAITIVSCTIDSTTGTGIVIVAIDVVENLVDQILDAVEGILQAVINLLDGLACDIFSIVPICNNVAQTALVPTDAPVQFLFNLIDLPAGCTSATLEQFVLSKLAAELTPLGVPTSACKVVGCTINPSAATATVTVAVNVATNLVDQVVNAVGQILQAVVNLLGGLLGLEVNITIGNIVPVINGVAQPACGPAL